MNPRSRREFLESAATAIGGSALALSGRTANAAVSRPAPATTLFATPPIERVRMALVGIGGMGSVHLENFLAIDGVEVRAVCDIVPEKVTRAFVDDCLKKHLDGKLDTTDASMAKWWATEAQNRLINTGVQLHGGYGYMMEYPIAKAFVDSRISTIYGGTTEIQKEIIGRMLGL